MWIEFWMLSVQWSNSSRMVLTRCEPATGRQSFLNWTLGYGVPNTRHSSLPFWCRWNTWSLRGSRNVGGSAQNIASNELSLSQQFSLSYNHILVTLNCTHTVNSAKFSPVWRRTLIRHYCMKCRAIFVINFSVHEIELSVYDLQFKAN